MNQCRQFDVTVAKVCQLIIIIIVFTLLFIILLFLFHFCFICSGYFNIQIFVQFFISFKICTGKNTWKIFVATKRVTLEKVCYCLPVRKRVMSVPVEFPEPVLPIHFLWSLSKSLIIYSATSWRLILPCAIFPHPQEF